MDAVDVYLDAPDLASMVKVGRLNHRSSHGDSVFSFAYAEEWLGSRQPFMLDPRLELFGGDQYPPGESKNFGIFLDSAPDRWGQVLLDRREALAAKDQGRKARSLRDWDYLLAVQDECRMGALRFRENDKAPFLDHQQLAAPPVTSLPELEAISLALEQDGVEALPAYRQWLARLIAPGTSLGGARPKANFREKDGSLWMAKFPSKEDKRDIGRWEQLLYGMAADCGIHVSPASVKQFKGKYHTFCVQRFDRTGAGRRLFVSALTLLERNDGEGGSYLELAEFLTQRGAQGGIKHDLEQIFRRVVFNVAVGNTDDHLRNHGFIRETTGWRVAPAYDLNPNPARRTHALRLDDASDVPDLDLVLSTAELYGLNARSAGAIVGKIHSVTSQWKARSRGAKFPAAEIAAVEEAFSLAC
jgi:serine/threonine-protein kinase HipA